MNRSLRRIGIKGCYGHGNFGDDALMVAVYQVVIKVFEPQSIAFFCQDAEYIQKMLPGVTVVSPDLENKWNADILLYGGGTQFGSFPLQKSRVIPSISCIVRNLREPTRIGPKILRRMRQLVRYSKTTQKIAAIGIGLGPFVENSHQLTHSQRLFRQMEYIAVRDIYSYGLCQEFGCNNLSLRTDLCYIPELWHNLKYNSLEETNGKINKIGVIVRDWSLTSEGDSYSDSLFHAIDSLRYEGKTVEFILFCASDTEWIKRLRDRGEHFTVWNPEHDSILSFLVFLSSYDLFISARYHGAIFASILKKPTVVIEIEIKLALVSDLLGAGARLWTYPFNVIQCLDYISEFECNYFRSVKGIDEVVKKQMCLAKKMVDDFEIFVREI